MLTCSTSLGLPLSAVSALTSYVNSTSPCHLDLRLLSTMAGRHAAVVLSTVERAAWRRSSGGLATQTPGADDRGLWLALSCAEKVLVVTQDGRTIMVRPRTLRPADNLLNHHPVQPALTTSLLSTAQGQLEGFDQTINVILSNSVERVYSMDEAVEEAPLGLYVVRGDNIVSTITVHHLGAWLE